MKFCNQCGQGNPDDAAFCVQCGTSVDEGAGAAPPVVEGAAPPPVEGAAPPPMEGEAPPPPGMPPPPPPAFAPGMPPPPPGMPGMPPPGYAPLARRQTDGMAVAALIMGIGGFFICPLVFGVLAVIFGYMGRGNIQKSGGVLEGDSFCTAGIILGFIQIGITLFFIILWVIIAIIAASSSASALAPAILAAGLLA